VLSRCDVWNHFISCTDEKQWKIGKRKAEKDELVGANYFATLQVPERPLNVADVYVYGTESRIFVQLGCVF
jgi:sorting nexin-9/18/33